MRNIFCTIVISLVIAVSGHVVLAKEWRGIVPLKSTRVQVEQLLGIPKTSSPWSSYYNLPSEVVVVQFQSGPCDQFGLGWNVPVGVVVGMGVIPKGSHRKEEYLLTREFKTDDSNGGFIYYSDEAAGISIETYKNLVTLVDYHPGARDEQQRCPRIQECCYDFFPIFDEYQKLPFEDEKARLDNFLIQMNQRSARGLIQVFGPSIKDRDQGLKLATRAKAYLVRQRRLEPERLLLVDGGYRSESVTRLSIYSVGGLPSRIYLFPEKDPVTTRPTNRMRKVLRENDGRTLDCRNANGYRFVVVDNPNRKKDSDSLIPQDVNIVVGADVIARIELPTEAKNFSLNSIEKTKAGFEMKVDWGGGLYHYEIQFNFRCKENNFYLYEVTKESFLTTNPESGNFLDKKESKVTKIEPLLPIEKFVMTDYL